MLLTSSLAPPLCNVMLDIGLDLPHVWTLMSVLKASILACRHIQGALTRREDLGVSAFRDTSRSEIVTADRRPSMVGGVIGQLLGPVPIHVGVVM
jgi:hypothetical protein